MDIVVIDPGPELFWYVRGALGETELKLEHLPNIDSAEGIIQQNFPKIVILNAEFGIQPIINFINKNRNYVFARNTIFIVFTSSSSTQDRQTLLSTGIGFVAFRHKGHDLPVKFFQGLIKWFFNYKAPDQQIFEHRPVPLKEEAELKTFGRVGWISPNQIGIETNLSLGPGDTISFQNEVFEELGIKNPKLRCIDKNKYGKYYQYANALTCDLLTDDPDQTQKILTAWINNNQVLSKHKPVKVLYFEAEYEYRKTIQKMVKQDSRLCARGFPSLDEMKDNLYFHIPQLVLINRELIKKDKTKFEPIKKYLQSHNAYCITYALEPNSSNLNECKKNYNFALHSPSPLDFSLLEKMGDKLQAKLIKHNPLSTLPKIFFNKQSVYGRITLKVPCRISELFDIGFGIRSQYNLSNFCVFELSSKIFTLAGIPRTQYARVFFSKNSSDKTSGTYHRCLFLGQAVNETKAIKDTMALISEIGVEKWMDSGTYVDSYLPLE